VTPLTRRPRLLFHIREIQQPTTNQPLFHKTRMWNPALLSYSECGPLPKLFEYALFFRFFSFGGLTLPPLEDDVPCEHLSPVFKDLSG